MEQALGAFFTNFFLTGPRAVKGNPTVLHFSDDEYMEDNNPDHRQPSSAVLGTAYVVGTGLACLATSKGALNNDMMRVLKNVARGPLKWSCE